MSILSDYTTENYLKAIVKHLSDPTHKKISTGQLAALLGVTSPTATVMMKKLEKQGYVRYHSHQGCTLTVEGARYGLNILRRHRLLETFLVTDLGLGWEEAHQEAERLEHAASDQLIQAISTKMGDPSKDPNGNMIPTRGQASFTVADCPFTEAPIAAPLAVSRLCPDSRMATYLQSQRIAVGRRVTVISVDEAIGIAQVDVDGQVKTISAKALGYFFYEPDIE
ncbi:MAG: metal-dependent transcriptional regulator [Sphaerochaeta sp.]|jgi:DtxR family Mn-dependent transcriptional regulator|nr:metal-dependent transcriptional regulator [Sphaerochaeta sp.]MDX9915712.1 metal-dependent transcriptional regulator [Sphaerochaeta sp.]